MAERPIRLLIADDHQILIDGLKTMMADTPEIEVVDTAKNGQEVLDKMKGANVEVILMDIQMPVLDGYEAAKQVITDYPETKVIILSMHSERVYIERMFRTGISGYLLKNAGKEEIIEAIKKIHAGERYFSKEITSAIFSKQSDQSSSVTISDLTKREREVLSHIASGKSNAQIAETLFLSEDTVKTHRKNMMRKLNVNNTASLVKYALENGVDASK